MFYKILAFMRYLNYCLIAEPINIFFQISSLIGQVLVSKFLLIFQYAFETAKLTWSFIQILYEDSLIFLKDATEKFTFALYLVKELYFLLEEFGSSFYKVVSKVLESLGNFLQLSQYIIGETKNGIQLTGSTIWQFFINVPDFVILNIRSVKEFIKNSGFALIDSLCELLENIFKSLEKTFHFLFYIPLDSIGGLIVGTVLITIICVKFKDICYLITSAFFKLYKQALLLCICLWSGRFLEQKRYEEYDYEDDERLCLICQHKLKEIIIFPCKHLCLCEDCVNFLTKNQPLCPVCRGNITETLKVYI